MSKNQKPLQKPTYKVYAVHEPTGGGETGPFWARIGSAWPHADGKGISVVFSVLPMNGRLVLREYDAEQDEETAGRRGGACERCED
jgi:hypothetical protein